jgi:hypothetical protein
MYGNTNPTDKSHSNFVHVWAILSLKGNKTLYPAPSCNVKGIENEFKISSQGTFQ